MHRSTERGQVFPIGEFALDLPAPEPVEGEEAEKPEPPFERAWPSPPTHAISVLLKAGGCIRHFW